MRERLPASLRVVHDILAETIASGGRNQLTLLASAMAYALVLSLAPLTIAFSMLGADRLLRSLAPGSPLGRTPLSPEVVAPATWAGPFAAAVAVVLVLWGAGALFVQLVDAVQRIWRGPAPHGGSGWRAFVADRLLSFALLAVAAAALFISSVAGTAASAVAKQAVTTPVLAAVDVRFVPALVGSRFVVDVLFSAVLYSSAFVVIPSPHPRFRDVLPGVAATAFAYALGQAVLSAYLGSAARFDALGAFGGFVAFLIWAYYTSSIVLWGAQFTYVLAKRRACARGGPDAERYGCADA